MFWLGAALAASSEGPACSVDGLVTPAEDVQVVWVSPVRKRVGANRDVTVVEVRQLRDFIAAEKADQTRVLQGLGMVGKRAGWRSRRIYKAVVFEVRAEELCRPIEGVEPGAVIGGARVCERSGGCGRSEDRLTGADGLEVFEIPWRDAARTGFCVVPMEVYVEEL